MPTALSRRGIVAAVAVVYLVNRLGRQSGLADGERVAGLPGDEIVARPAWQSTRAITIDAPPEQVWPWIVQMGFPSHRAGWYTPHWLDRLTFGIEERSADRIVPELQQLAVGDRVPDSADCSTFFTVAAIDPPHALVLHSTRHVIGPIKTIDFSWAFAVRNLPPGRSRLLIRARARYTPRSALPFVELVIGPADFLNAAAMLRGIRRRVESATARQVPETGAGPTPRELLRGLGEIAAASPLFLLAPLLRRWHLRWGATERELAAPMPGDRLVSNPSFETTRGITIAAPAEEVWRWLAQIGYGRGGFYSYDLLDNGGRPSADRILPEFQQPRIGDRVPMAAKMNETTAFTISEIAPNRSLLWEKPHSTWAWKLEPLPGGRTRLLTRLKDRYQWRSDPAGALLSAVLLEFGDFPMMRKLLLNLKRRAEQTAPDSA